MPFFRRIFAGPLCYPRVAVFAALLLALAELLFRSAELYPYDPSVRFNFLQTRNGIAPSARQIAEAVDHVRSHARPGDWVLIGDSVMNGAYTPLSGSPVALMREELRKSKPDAQVWDLSLAGEDPAMEAAILTRLGELPGVKLFVDVGVKIIARPEKALYYALLWKRMESWDSTLAPLRMVLRDLQEEYFATYQPSGTYGDNVEELRAQSWADSHVALLEIDHWFRYHFCAKPFSKLVTAALLDGWKPQGAKAFDVTDVEGSHQEIQDSPDKQKQVAWWWGTQVEENDPRWKAVTRLFEILSAKRGSAVVSLHTVSFKRVASYQPEFRKPIEDAYQRLKGAAGRNGLTVIEPASFIELGDYADADHFRINGNRAWVRSALAAAAAM